MVGGTDVPRGWIKPEFLTAWSREVVGMMGDPSPDALIRLWKYGPPAEVVNDTYLCLLLILK